MMIKKQDPCDEVFFKKELSLLYLYTNEKNAEYLRGKMEIFPWGKNGNFR